MTLLNLKLNPKICSLNNALKMAVLKVILFLESIVNELNELISSTKSLYYENLAKKLNNPLVQIKTYW